MYIQLESIENMQGSSWEKISKGAQPRLRFKN